MSTRAGSELPAEFPGRGDRRNSDASIAPTVTVIMPVRNEEAYIATSLSAVLAQDYPADRLDVIVVDGQSTDTTREIVRSLQRRHSNLTLIDNPGRIVSTGMNLALAKAGGEIIVRVDGHCEVAPDYVRRCVERLRLSGADGVGGAVITVGETLTARAIAAAMSSWFGVGGSAFRTHAKEVLGADTVPFPAYRRTTIVQVGPYDEELVRNQDDEYNYRLRKLGGRLLLAADVGSRYYSRSSFSSLARQHLQYGYWKVRVLQKHPRQMRWRQFVPPVFVATLSLLAVLSLLSRVAVGALATVLVLYGVAALFASVRQARRDDWRLAPLLAASFVIMHVSYGAGFIAGLLAFRGRWNEHRLNEALAAAPGP